MSLHGNKEFKTFDSSAMTMLIDAALGLQVMDEDVRI
jgi:hypothetical protein